MRKGEKRMNVFKKKQWTRIILSLIAVIVAALFLTGIIGGKPMTYQLEEPLTPMLQGIADTMAQNAENSEAEEVSDEEENTEHGETVGLTVYLPKDKANIDLLRQLVQGKSGLIKKALGLKDLPIEEDSDEIVFPWFADASDLSPDEVKAYTAFISALCKLSANAKRVSMTEKPVDNEKYAFRCFLLRLGFIGREHKITRKILLRNLEGSSAFKNGGSDDETSE